jgi:hypothetical protein
MEALPSLKVEKEASGEAVVKDIQRVSVQSREPSRAQLSDSSPRTKTNLTMRSSLSSPAVFNLYRKRRTQRNLPLMTRTRLSGGSDDS